MKHNLNRALARIESKCDAIITRLLSLETHIDRQRKLDRVINRLHRAVTTMDHLRDATKMTDDEDR